MGSYIMWPFASGFFPRTPCFLVQLRCSMYQCFFAMSPILKVFIFFKILFILFLDRGEGREKERERNINVWLPLPCPLLGSWPTTQACALTWNQTGNPVVHRLAFSPLSHTSQGSTNILRAARSPP